MYQSDTTHNCKQVIRLAVQWTLETIHWHCKQVMGCKAFVWQYN